MCLCSPSQNPILHGTFTGMPTACKFLRIYKLVTYVHTHSFFCNPCRHDEEAELDDRPRLRREPVGCEGVMERGNGGEECNKALGSPQNMKEGQDRGGLENRRVVFVSARVHPGETPASWIMHGFLDFLTSPNEPVAQRLRQRAVFKVVPMLNPDGVALGNYRTNLHGSDLNRCWANPERWKSREIYHAKRLLASLSAPASLFLDLHAHSRMTDCFLYGCGELRRGSLAFGEDASSNHSTSLSQPSASCTELFPRVLPRMLADSCDAFNYSSCRFSVHKSKEGCARVVAHRELKIEAAYTLEASFLGGTLGQYKGRHYTQKDFLEIGRKLCEAIAPFLDEEILHSKMLSLDADERQKSNHRHLNHDVVEGITVDKTRGLEGGSRPDEPRGLVVDEPSDVKRDRACRSHGIKTQRPKRAKPPRDMRHVPRKVGKERMPIDEVSSEQMDGNDPISPLELCGGTLMGGEGALMDSEASDLASDVDSENEVLLHTQTLMPSTYTCTAHTSTFTYLYFLVLIARFLSLSSFILGDLSPSFPRFSEYRSSPLFLILRMTHRTHEGFNFLASPRHEPRWPSPWTGAYTQKFESSIMCIK
jgi:hypothetical protein